jgi:phage terminase small subunit
VTRVKKRKAGTKKPAKKPAVTVSEKLTAQQERFCEEYLIDYNGTEAATRAGYSKKTAASQAWRLLRNAKILSRVRELQAEQATRLAMTSDWVLLQLRECVQHSMAKEPVMEWDEEERCLKPSGFWQYDSKGATRALELIGRQLSMFNDKKTINIALPVVITGADQLED